MTTYHNKIAVVTGAASGIGLALSKELINRGAKVWMTDINQNTLLNVSKNLGPSITSVYLDVRDATAFKKLIGEIINSEGRVDYLFNNAGIGVGGEAHDMTVAHYDRIIDINIRGVTNGIAATYPEMVRQGHGTIVNTASAAGLAPIPLLAAYAMTKHAVVGLSRSIRMEGAHYGVNINALCPTAIETPILDSTGPEDLENPWTYGARDYLCKLAPAYPVNDFAKYTLDQVAKNKELIVAPIQGRIVAWLFRHFPGLVRFRAKQLYLEELKERSDHNRANEIAMP